MLLSRPVSRRITRLWILTSLSILKVTDPEKVITQVQNFKQAAVGIATTTLRAVMEDIELDEVLAKREYINSVLRGEA